MTSYIILRCYHTKAFCEWADSYDVWTPETVTGALALPGYALLPAHHWPLPEAPARFGARPLGYDAHERPLTCSAKEVDRMLEVIDKVEAPREYQPGERLQVTSGLFEGNMVTFIKYKSRNRARVQVTDKYFIDIDRENIRALLYSDQSI